jgi:tetratricopeptide (TPR) repeat protein
MESRRRGAIWSGLLAVLVTGSFAAWAWTRSDALERASRLSGHAQEPEALAHVVRLALDHLDRRPWESDADLLAARGLSRLDYPDLAEPHFRRVEPLALADALVRAYAILRSNDRERAISAYRAITDRWPDDPRAWRSLGGIYMSRRQYLEALEVAHRLSTLPGGELDGHRMAGTLQHELQTPEAAVAEFEAVLRLDPELKSSPADARSAFWSFLASDLLALGQAERAVDYLRTELARRGDPVLRTLLGKAYYQLGDLAQARDCWERSVEADPRFGPAWLELGRLALAENRLPEARTALETARRFAPRDPEILFSLRNVYQRLGLHDEAEALRRQAEAAQKQAPPKTQGMGARSQLTDPQPISDPAPADRRTPPQ